MFDLGRLRISQASKMEALLQRNCDHLMKSVDKINPIANYMCILLLGFGMLVVLYLFMTMPSTFKSANRAGLAVQTKKLR
eukprot:NODE_4912_length_617_cov_73.410211_g4228_i0.p1 GENE.NODE_4912_length_617_cov_73.410211_g4228_i0~~NODE_4912_length_617_cov_73.410211_g4228_i0.p1  ORF type:complete len:80 (+),score=21.65 NODE_4912_length_617_cov_73.410211_g4228_i0:328-567(+)